MTIPFNDLESLARWASVWSSANEASPDVEQNGALQDFNHAILIKPDSFPDVYVARGLLKIKMNDKNGGCLDLHHAFKLQPDSITGHYIDINCK